MNNREPKIVGATTWWKCSGCKEWKLPSHFSKVSQKVNNLSSKCRGCTQAYTKKDSSIQEAKKKQMRIPADMNQKRFGLMTDYKRTGESQSLSYDEFDEIPDITNILKEVE